MRLAAAISRNPACRRVRLGKLLILPSRDHKGAGIPQALPVLRQQDSNSKKLLCIAALVSPVVTFFSISTVQARSARHHATGAWDVQLRPLLLVGVGIMVTHNPLHRSGRADFPHPAPALGDDAEAAQGIVMIDAGRREPAINQPPHCGPR